MSNKFGFLSMSYVKLINCLLICFFCFNMFISPVCAASLDDKKSELEGVRDKLRLEKKKLSEANEKENELSRQLKENQKLLFDAQEKVREVSGVMKTTVKALKRMKKELSIAEKSFKSHQKQLDSRLQSIYENVDPSNLIVLTEAKTFSEFINTLYYLEILVDDDFRLLNRIQREKLEIAKKKVAVETRYNKVLDLKKQLNKKEAHIASIVDDKKYLVALLHEERMKHSDKVIKLEDNAQNIENQIQKIINGQSSSYETYAVSNSAPVGDGSLSCWPAPGPVTSTFGWRIHPIYGEWRFHSGVDIGADYGVPIAAAGDGVVITSEWIGGYGNAVMIDHGGGIVTLYGHCSSLNVSYGQHVTKGQTVAYVGSTGNSTGPHLHFEVRQNGVSVDPAGFVN